MSEAQQPAIAELSASVPNTSEPQTTSGIDSANGAASNGEAAATIGSNSKEVAIDAPATDNTTNDKQPSSEDIASDKPAPTQETMEPQEDIKLDDAPTAADESTLSTADTPVGKAKARRKSSGVPEHTSKKLKKKASKAKMTHTDAKPGDYFYVRLKGYPLWPAIVCDESMLPQNLLKSRPVTAARPDGTYREDYEDGGKKVNQRTFPVMYLHTNEFGFIPNTDLLDIDFEEVGKVPASMRKDLAAAHQLAAERHTLDYFKEVLKQFMEARQADALAKEAAKAELAEKAEKKAKSTVVKKEKKSSKTVNADEDEDTDMPDAVLDNEDQEIGSEKPKTKKRPAEETLPGAESAKKPKLKLTHSTPKATNGTATPKSTKVKSATKSAKPKSVKKAGKTEIPEIVVPQEPELSAEGKRVKKEKEILFLRHKLQKGLLTKGQDPKEEEMKQMSEYVGKLEGYSDLEVSIIRATKINKVLKAILKLPSIPKEDEYSFKTRSKTLLDKWNKILDSDTSTPVGTGTNGATDGQAETEEGKDSPVAATNGTKESSADEKVEEKTTVVEPTSVVKEAVVDTDNAPVVDEPMKDAPAVVESTA